MIPAVIFALIVAAVPTLALLVYSIELTTGLVRGARSHPPQGSASVAVLIPAHNEAQGIGRTVSALLATAPAGTRVLVVADNCSDETAARARAAGAEAIERSDAVLRGKGFALAFGRDALAQAPPDVVIVLDADCELSDGSVQRLAAAASKGSPAQAVYTFIPDRTAPPLVQISNFALLIKNLVRSRGLSRLGGGALLTGTGMAFPWTVFADAPLASGDITEDLNLGIALARRGIRPKLVEDAAVLSAAAGVSESVSQRTRWEHGFLRNAMESALPTVRDGIARGSPGVVALGCHLLVPPLALLFLISAAVLLPLLLFGYLASVWAPAIMLAAALTIAFLLTLVAWQRYGRETLGIGALLKIPLYVAWKIPIYLRFIVKPETTWRRTTREHERQSD